MQAIMLKQYVVEEHILI